jgi:membrane associated rhomboid family serine protease
MAPIMHGHNNHFFIMKNLMKTPSLFLVSGFLISLAIPALTQAYQQIGSTQHVSGLVHAAFYACFWLNKLA